MYWNPEGNLDGVCFSPPPTSKVQVTRGEAGTLHHLRGSREGAEPAVGLDVAG